MITGRQHNKSSRLSLTRLRNSAWMISRKRFGPVCSGCSGSAGALRSNWLLSKNTAFAPLKGYELGFSAMISQADAQFNPKFFPVFPSFSIVFQ